MMRARERPVRARDRLVRARERLMRARADWRSGRNRGQEETGQACLLT